MKFQRLIWYAFLVIVALGIVALFPAIQEGLRFIRGNAFCRAVSHEIFPRST